MNEIGQQMQTEEESCRYLISLIAGFLNRREPLALPESLSWQQVYETAKRHGLESMAFYGAAPLLEKDRLYGTWKKRVEQNLLQCLLQSGECGLVLDTFSKNGIPVLPLKGCVMRERYGQPDYRQMSDLDFLVEEEQIDRAGDLLLEMGYEKNLLEADHHEEFMKQPYVKIELHRAMVPETSVYSSYYRTIWRRVQDKEGENGCRLSLEDEYIFLLVHFARHFELDGSGIRSVLDVFVFLNQCGKKLNRRYLEREFSSLGLYAFWKQTEALARSWFSPEAGRERIQDEVLKEMEKSIFFSGAYGSRMGRIVRDTGGRTGLGKAGYLVGRIFMKRSLLSYSYPVLRRFPFLLPFCWIHRLLILCLWRRDRIFEELEILRLRKKEEKRKRKNIDK